jgi:heptosyltransferase I
VSHPRQLQRDRGNPRLKFLDRYVGIPVVVALGAARRLRGRRAVPSGWCTVGLMVTAGIGDAVLLTGILDDVRVGRPEARIVVFVTANNASFARLLRVPDAIVELPVRQPWIAARRVRDERCDVIVDFGAWRRFDAAIAARSGAVTIGRRTAGQHRHFAYDVVRDHQRDHELDNDRRLIAAIGVRSTSPPALQPDASVPQPAAQRSVVLHLWPGGANFDERSWPVDRWRELGRRLDDDGLDLVLTGGPEDAEATERLAAAWRAEGLDVQSIAGCSWPETIAWLAGARGVFSVNTGVMHVAAALGTPVVALNGPTSGTRWGPVGLHTRCVASPMVPDGYLNLGFERDDRYRDCMTAITVESVFQAWKDLCREVETQPTEPRPGRPSNFL